MPSTVYDKPLLQADRQRTVNSILITASGTINTTLNEPNVFHWQLYMLLSPSEPAVLTKTQSVVVDMIPANPPVGTVYVASKESTGLDAEPKVELSIATAGSPLPTIQQLLDLLIEKGVDRYMFDETGSGCLHWIITAVEQLEGAGLVEPAASAKLRDFHREQVKQHPERHPMPIRKGTFYWYVSPFLDSYLGCTS
ncbi:hypothetical protein BV20DRAFT_288977 [Pilatotrama ljubarskyi]|nr:hypothetical protein BV20DRAFT_288977 [Pilatotrama ljubarskyi]